MRRLRRETDLEPFICHHGVAAALLRSNVDTDTIIPSTEMKSVSKVGLSIGLFANLRYIDVAARQPNPEFVLNRFEQRGTSVLLCGMNFGCGSSREHAVWALKEYGIKVVIAPSFGTIFASNCVRNGILPAVLNESIIAEIASSIEQNPQAMPLTINLADAVLITSDATRFAFSIDSSQREMLLSGMDPIAMTLAMDAEIHAFQSADQVARPWIYL